MSQCRNKTPSSTPVKKTSGKEIYKYDSSWLDDKARGFWRRGLNPFIDVRVTNPGAITRAQESVEKILEKHERENERAYNERIMNVERGTSYLHRINVYHI